MKVILTTRCGCSKVVDMGMPLQPRYVVALRTPPFSLEDGPGPPFVTIEKRVFERVDFNEYVEVR